MLCETNAKKGRARFLLHYLSKHNTMIKIKFILVFITMLSSATGWGQKADTLIRQLDSMQKNEQKQENKPKIDVDKDEYTSKTNITFPAYFTLLGTDLFQEIRSPFHASK